MNLPTEHQIVVAGTHVATAAATAVATLGMVHLLSPADVSNATGAISQITEGVGKIMAGVGTLIAIGSGVYATIMASPFASLFRSSATIAADPAKMAQLKAAPTAQQAVLATVANAVPSPTVQPTTPKVA